MRAETVPGATSSLGTSRSPSASVTINRRNAALESVTELTGRVLLASLFLLSGLTKLSAYGVTATYMAAFRVPAALLPLVIATEVLGALAIILGWQTRGVAGLLAAFSVLAAVTFHTNFGDQIQMIMFLKNLSIAGGFLLLVANGAGPLSFDRHFVK
jgi:putative oxidoreductase